MEEDLLNLDNSSKKQLIIWRVVSLILLVFLVTVGILYALGVGWKKDEEKENKQEQKGGNDESILTLWTQNSTIFTKLVPYIKKVTDNNNQNFIPVEDRIAVFDLDGTLFCETDPIYFDWDMFAYRVLDDPDYNKTAETQDRELANQIRAANIHDLPPDIEGKHCWRNPFVFKDMKMEDFISFTKNFLNQKAPGYINMKRGDAFYKPMLQVIDYLQKNDFKVFIVTGTDRFTVRTIVDGHINIPERQIIGTISTIKASGQGDEKGINYDFKKNDEILLGGGFVIKNVKMNKISTITTEIGQKPVLSFGNSGGDKSMANYVISNNKYESLAFMLCCDDEIRENGNKTKAESMYKLCSENNFQPISMEKDWKTIYGDDVKKKTKDD